MGQTPHSWVNNLGGSRTGPISTPTEITMTTLQPPSTFSDAQSPVAVAVGDPSRKTVPLGQALEGARRRVQFSLEAAAGQLGIDVRELGLYECGLRTPRPDVLKAMGELYGVDPSRLDSRPYLPRIPPRIDRAAKTLELGWMSIDLAPVDERPDEANEYLVRSIAGSLRTMRGLDVGQPVYLRRSEFPLLATLLDTEDDELAVLFMKYLSLGYNEVDELIDGIAGSISND